MSMTRALGDISLMTGRGACLQKVWQCGQVNDKSGRSYENIFDSRTD